MESMQTTFQKCAAATAQNIRPSGFRISEKDSNDASQQESHGKDTPEKTSWTNRKRKLRHHNYSISLHSSESDNDFNEKESGDPLNKYSRYGRRRSR